MFAFCWQIPALREEEHAAQIMLRRVFRSQFEEGLFFVADDLPYVLGKLEKLKD
jgi:hypothetical protein